jgi:hypothetical protein
MTASTSFPSIRRVDDRSAVPRTADIGEHGRHVAVGPQAAVSNRSKPTLFRGRDVRFIAPPAQNRTCGFPAYGSHLGCVTAKRAHLKSTGVAARWGSADIPLGEAEGVGARHARCLRRRRCWEMRGKVQRGRWRRCHCGACEPGADQS